MTWGRHGKDWQAVSEARRTVAAHSPLWASVPRHQEAGDGGMTWRAPASPGPWESGGLRDAWKVGCGQGCGGAAVTGRLPACVLSWLAGMAGPPERRGPSTQRPGRDRRRGTLAGESRGRAWRWSRCWRRGAEVAAVGTLAAAVTRGPRRPAVVVPVAAVTVAVSPVTAAVGAWPTVWMWR